MVLIRLPQLIGTIFLFSARFLVTGTIVWQTELPLVYHHTILPGPEPGQHLLAAGAFKSTDTYNAFYFSLFNSNGSLIWHKKWHGSGVRDAVYKTADGEYVIGAVNTTNLKKPFLINLNSSGVITKVITITSWDQFIPKSIVEDPQRENYIIVGSAYSNVTFAGMGIVLLKVSPKNGTVIWSCLIERLNDITRNSLIPAINGGYVIGGYSTPQVGDYISHLVKITEDGRLEWKKILDATCVNSVKKTEDGNYVLAGSKTIEDVSQAVVIECDSNGNVKWYKMLNTAVNSMFYSAVKGSNERYYAIGHAFSPNRKIDVLTVLDKNKTVWKKIWVTFRGVSYSPDKLEE
eukprot:TRINITY_DN705_c0_g1_i2.p2 TRINITY_DN705_c0_g1~~TRINITY_DN705_c0_g1_i2.p2  ORF type:complete len:347 (-),score=9.46 TRINITY_DN705_c0_g1_i2:928-1968(-)